MHDDERSRRPPYFLCPYIPSRRKRNAHNLQNSHKNKTNVQLLVVVAASTLHLSKDYQKQQTKAAMGSIYWKKHNPLSSSVMLSNSSSPYDQHHHQHISLSGVVPPVTHPRIWKETSTGAIGTTTTSNNNSNHKEKEAKVYLAYDGRMTLHKPIPVDHHDHEDNDDDDEIIMERPERVRAIYEKLKSMPRADYRFIELPCLLASREAIQLVHSPEHYDRMWDTAWMTPEELQEISIPNDLFYGKDTFFAARMAVGGVLECVKAVTNPRSSSAESKRAIAVVRPPGHHALHNEAMGFCYFNNIAIAAKHAIVTGRAQRVFILDWDIHHGNGIQDLTYDDPSIFYVSIHRGGISGGNTGGGGGGGGDTTSSSSSSESEHPYQEQQQQQESYFYPGTGRPTEVGNAGTNMNIAWHVGGMGDEEYTAAFTQMVIPALQHFRADLILVACGLDAVKGDLIGDCGLSEDMYYRMTRMLIDATESKVPIVVVLEGGYNIETSANCMEKIALALLDEPLIGQQEVDGGDRCSQETTISSQTKRKRSSRSKRDAAHLEALRAIQRSAQALQRKGGTCMSGCHYKCKHVSAHHALPFKKRRSYKKVSGSPSPLPLPLYELR